MNIFIGKIKKSKDNTLEKCQNMIKYESNVGGGINTYIYWIHKYANDI